MFFKKLTVKLTGSFLQCINIHRHTHLHAYISTDINVCIICSSYLSMY